FYVSTDYRTLHSFPTRRSSDLADDRECQEAQRRPHCGSSAGKMWRVLSHLFAPPPRCRDTAREAASIAMTFPTTMRGTESTPSRDRKSTRLNSSHRTISYAVFC